ncbi:MAG: type III-A CRISPR-associated RAMP protein Csm5 [Anaerolineae bacterium]|nr:type III-A CRISPR-associated RAMP protein Csm5 [Anaerolineae bacterium]
MNRYIHYALTVEVLSPLHIWSGQKLLPDEDYIVNASGHTLVFDHDALFRAVQSEDGTFDDKLLSLKPVDLYFKHVPEELRKTVFRYAMNGRPISREREIREATKDLQSRPYLPGTSLKGALRTLLLWDDVNRSGLALAGSMEWNDYKHRDVMVISYQRGGDRWRPLETNAKYAAGPVEREVFARDVKKGQAPNQDFMRAVQMADSQSFTRKALMVATARVFTSINAMGNPNNRRDTDLEIIQAGAKFQASLTVESYGFEDREAQKLGWDDVSVKVDALPVIGREKSSRIIANEKKFYQDKGGPSEMLETYDLLGKQALAENEWLMQLGWGGGWESKTLGDLLRAQGAQFDQLIDAYDLSKRHHKPGMPFPFSRRLILSDGQPAIPMGWVKCRLDRL